MTRFKIWSGGALVLVALFLISMCISQASAFTPPPPKGGLPVHRPFHIEDSYVPGSRAIPVHNVATTIGSTTQAFSRNDVITYLNTQGFPAGPVVAGSHLKILSIQFVTSKQASNLMAGESVGRPDNSLVCYVKVEGPFLLTNIHAGPNFPGKKIKTTADIGDIVFDGQTGNMLVWGIY